jgi:hypothetical protein
MANMLSVVMLAEYANTGAAAAAVSSSAAGSASTPIHE